MSGQSKLVKMELEDLRHSPNFVYFDAEAGDAYYGPDEDHLTVLSHMTFWHRRNPPSFLEADIVRAFRLGLEAGRGGRSDL